MCVCEQYTRSGQVDETKLSAESDVQHETGAAHRRSAAHPARQVHPTCAEKHGEECGDLWHTGRQAGQFFHLHTSQLLINKIYLSHYWNSNLKTRNDSLNIKILYLIISLFHGKKLLGLL